MDLEHNEKIKSEMLEKASEDMPMRTFRKVALGAAMLGTATASSPAFPMWEQPSRRGTRVGVRTSPKIGRNAFCPCGSGIKYKRCLCTKYHA